MQIKLNLQSGLMQMNFANWISNCILLPFNNYLEEWEHVARVTKNSAQEKLIKDKYMYIYLYDDDASDLRRVVDIE